jgi:inosine-uridine nucleoside N-ribohydrolase
MTYPYHFNVPDLKKIRLIINTDAKNEADDQFAIVHALLTPRFCIRGIIAAQFGTRRTTQSMQESYEEILKILELMDFRDAVDVFHGAASALPDELSPQMSEGAELIVREAMADDPRPLYAIFLGPLTDIASAYLANPQIAGRVTVIWIGGGKWPVGGEEFNLSNDIHAANIVFQSTLPLWQVPRDVFSTMRVSLAELQDKVEPCGKTGAYLFRQMVEVNDFHADNLVWPAGESWCLGDSPAVGLLLDPHEFDYEWLPAPRFREDMSYEHGQNNRPIRVYRRIDARFILEDFFSKLRLNFTQAGSSSGK